jgi:gas vesicle protein
MTELEQSMVDEMKELIKDQNEKIRDQDTYIKELQQEMSDMVNKEYDC